uniref:Uncharacterized protein n=1 Tax=Helianthus annuus TaxID=4232 RepID=A0A251UJJ2_HELAN
MVYFEISKGSHITTVKLGKILDEHGILLMPDSSSRWLSRIDEPAEGRTDPRDETNKGAEYGTRSRKGLQYKATSFCKKDGFECLLRGFRKTGEPIVEMLQNLNDSNAPLAVYEPYSKSFNNLGINGMSFSFSVYPYMETLLLLDQPNFITFDKGKRYIQSEEVRT